MLILKQKYFRDATFPFQYDGSYKEEFNFFGETDLIIDEPWGSEWQLCARGNAPNDNGLVNKADIQVYWYDNCDMWLELCKGRK